MAKKKKTILRVVFYPERFTTREGFSIFKGDIKEDKRYWKKYHNAKAKYFELKGID